MADLDYKNDVAAEFRGSSEGLPVYNPATGEQIATVPGAT